MTGLGHSGRAMMKYFLRRQDKYDFHYYCTQTTVNDSNLSRMPCKAYGCIPTDPNIIQALNQDPGRARDVSYGGMYIDEIVKREQPDIYLGSDDAWGFNGYTDKAWWNQINTILHITLDSRPILDAGFEAAKKTKSYFSWAKFAALDMHKAGPEYSHVSNIYGASEASDIQPISQAEKDELRRKFGIDKDATIFLMVNRNQLRKGFAICLKAFADFKRKNPTANAKLWYHCSWSEKSQGWDIEKLSKFYGVKTEDVLCTYVCKHCGNWHVAPYKGEDQDCPFCRSPKSNITITIANGVPFDEMKYVFGMADAGLSIFNSGGHELMSTNALFAGLYTAITNYSCGEDFANLPFVESIGWSPYYEAGSNFIKAASNPSDITDFMMKVHRMSRAEKAKISEQARDYAVKTFSVETIGAQWEAVFDALPPKDWSSITLSYKPKNPDLPMPTTANNEEWVRELYQKVLLCDPDPQGFQHWLQSLQNNVSRDAIYRFFCERARDDNAKNQPPKDLWSVIDKTTGKKRAIWVCPQSLGDLVMSTALFESFHEQYPNHDLYVATGAQYVEALAGNPHVFKVLIHQPFMSQELQMTSAGLDGDPYFHVFLFPAVASQAHLSYLSQSNPLVP